MASWVSGYALTNDYTAGRLTSFASVRLCLRRFQDVLSSVGAANRSSLARTLKYLWDHGAHVVRCRGPARGEEG
jgi:hypothetical protein